MQPLVSIIMPVYNTGEILNKTVDSIRKQTFSDFELIIIDDGSREETAMLCDSFSAQDARIKVIHKENSGTCAARNVGIDIARGKYITFCDHDDVYDAKILEKEIELITGTDKCEMAIVGAIHICDDGKKLKYSKNISLADKNSVEKSTAKILRSGILGTVWNIMYRKTLIGETRFNEKLKKGHEDIIFNIEIYQKTSSLISTDEILYYHYIRKSMSTSAGYHEEAIEAIKIANDGVCEICNSVFDKINIDDYIMLQGEYIKTYTSYLIHLGKSFTEFRNKMAGLRYIPVRFVFTDLLQNRNKDSFCYYCLRQEKLRLLYCLTRMNTQLKGRRNNGISFDSISNIQR